MDARGETIGEVDGFIVDVRSERPFYVVVNAGGWFKSKYFLLPIGEVTLDAKRRQMIATHLVIWLVAFQNRGASRSVGSLSKWHRFGR